MVHILGNSTHCVDCISYRPKTENDHTIYDGFCVIGHIVNGRRISFEPRPVYWNNGTGCQDWVERKRKITHFEAMTRKPDPKRTEMERIYFEKLLRGETDGTNQI